MDIIWLRRPDVNYFETQDLFCLCILRIINKLLPATTCFDIKDQCQCQPSGAVEQVWTESGSYIGSCLRISWQMLQAATGQLKATHWGQV